MRIVITRQAEKDMDGIAVKDRMRIIRKIEAYAANPKGLASQVKRLRGRPELRLRIGNYRVFFTEDGVVLIVLHVGHRREIYR